MVTGVVDSHAFGHRRLFGRLGDVRPDLTHCASKEKLRGHMLRSHQQRERGGKVVWAGRSFVVQR